LPAEAHETEPRLTTGRELLSLGSAALTAVPHDPLVSVVSRPCTVLELSVKSPTTVQLPTEEHETALRVTPGLAEALPGSDALTPWAQVPLVSVRSRPSVRFELSVYRPTAVQSPAEGHATEVRTTLGLGLASSGSGASMPVPQLPAVSVRSRPSRPLDPL
jgi:hypothetical protein